MNKPLKIFLILISIIIILAGILFANAIYGNPISKAKAKGLVNKYIMQTYRDTDFVIYDISYNFKDGYYHAEVISPNSIDTHFNVAVSFNKVVHDSYEDDVLTGWNTWQRIDKEYREMVDKVLEAKDFPLVSDIDFGTIEFMDESNLDDPYDPTEPDYGIKLSDLEIDKIYDIHQLGKESGHIIYYAQNADVSFEKAGELLLLLKSEFDKADVPFYAIDFVLEKPRTDGRSPSDSEQSIYTVNFLYEDISETDLVDRIEQNHQLLMEYYGEQDNLTKEKK